MQKRSKHLGPALALVTITDQLVKLSVHNISKLYHIMCLCLIISPIQEHILVGCVSSAAVTVLGEEGVCLGESGCLPGGVCPWVCLLWVSSNINNNLSLCKITQNPA